MQKCKETMKNAATILDLISGRCPTLILLKMFLFLRILNFDSFFVGKCSIKGTDPSLIRNIYYLANIDIVTSSLCLSHESLQGQTL